MNFPSLSGFGFPHSNSAFRRISQVIHETSRYGPLNFCRAINHRALAAMKSVTAMPMRIG